MKPNQYFMNKCKNLFTREFKFYINPYILLQYQKRTALNYHSFKTAST